MRGKGQRPPPVLWYVWRGDCPVCQRAEPWLDEIETAYPTLEIRKVDVLQDLAGRARFERMMTDRGTRATAVPTFILEDRVWVGFIVGLFAALEVAARLGWIRVAVALLALAFGLFNVKDLLAFKRGPSLTIPDRFKPRIYRGGRMLREDRPLPLTLAMTVGIAGGVALIELPCTAGFPVIWTTLVSEAAVGQAAFLGLLFLYLGVYLSIEVAILAAAIITLRATRLQEGHGRKLKLVGGTVMIALAGVLLVDPAIMESLVGSLVVVGGALGLSILVILVERQRSRRQGPEREPKGGGTMTGGGP